MKKSKNIEYKEEILIKNSGENILQKKRDTSIFVFKNAPIKDPASDVFDYTMKADSINEAIESGANSIGLIGDYGSGKSSIIEILYALYPDKFERPVIINLWNCSQPKYKKTDTDEENELVTDINDFTKSFLYQLAVKGSPKKYFARYINQRLSSNYGKISLSSSKRRVFLPIILGAAFLLMWKFDETSFINFSFSNPNNWFEITLNFLINRINHLKEIGNGPLILFAGILITFAFRNGNFLFSLWDSQGKIEPKDTDYFDVFSEIIERIKPKFEKKRIIVIEDLDRSNNPKAVINLLKEIYRLNNLLSEEDKSKFVFIISLKSETSLCEKGEVDSGVKNELEGKQFYSKIFDYTIWVNPIHFNNVNDVLKSLLSEKFSVREIGDFLPELQWIKKGENITVREIKERLNEVFLLYTSLKSRSKENENLSVSLKKCSAVVYLKRTYPKEFSFLQKKEASFSRLIRTFYISYEKEKALSDFKTSFTSEEKDFCFDLFCKDLQDLLDERAIDLDYLMYFYTYPKNSYIMDVQEKHVYDHLINNSYYFDHDEEEELQINYIIAKKNAKIIQQAFEELVNSAIRLGLYFFNFEKVFALVYKKNGKYVKNSFLEYFNENLLGENKNEAYFYLSKILHFSEETIPSFEKTILIQTAIGMTVEKYSKTKQINDIETFRFNVLSYMPELILQFQGLFFSPVCPLPLISISSFQQINNSQQIKSVTDFARIPEDKVGNYLEHLFSIDFRNDADICKELVKIPSLKKHPEVVDSLLAFFEKNDLFDSTCFLWIYDELTQRQEIETLIQYIEKDSICALLSNEEWEKIDDLETDIFSSELVLKQFEKQHLLKSLLLSRIKSNTLDKIDWEQEWIKDKLEETGKVIFGKNESYLIVLRKFLIQENIKREIFYPLYSGGLPFITDDEFSLMKVESKDFYWLSDFGKITIECIDKYSGYCNKKRLNSQQLYSFLEQLLFYDEKNRVSNKEIIWKLLEGIDFSSFKMQSIQLNEIEEKLRAELGLEKPSAALRFLEAFQMHITVLDDLLIKEAKEDDSILNQYVGVIKKINDPSLSVLDLLGSINFTDPLTEKINNRLYEKGYYRSYIISSSMNNRNCSLEDKIPLNEYYLVFEDNDFVADIMVQNIDLIQAFVEDSLYTSKLSVKKILCFNRVKQTCRLLSFVFENLNDIQYLLDYFKDCREIISYEECDSFVEYLRIHEEVQKKMISSETLEDYINRLIWAYKENNGEKLYQDKLKRKFKRIMRKMK